MKISKRLADNLLRVREQVLDATSLYRPLEGAQRFHELDVKWRILDGSNRSGKTLAAAVEVARAVTARDPYDKYIHHNGRAIVVGLDTSHLATIYSKLFEPGALKIIFDEEKNQFRPLRVIKDGGRVTICPKDMEKRDSWMDAPPLIPQRYIRSIAWYDRARRVPARVLLTTGWVISFHSSLGRAPQGEHYDLAWIDEAIANDQFYYEISRGIVDLGSAKKSKAIWSACPQIPNYQLWELRREAESGSPRVAAFRLTIDTNPYVDDEEKRAFYNSLSPLERQTRYYGVHAIDALRAYPHFRCEDPYLYDPFPITDDYTIYMAVDPGARRCGTVFGAVSPDNRFVYIFKAFAVAGGVEPWAAAVAEVPEAKRIHMAVIDPVAGKSRQLTGTASVAKVYYLALIEKGIRPQITGPLDGFFSGERNRDVRREILCQGFRLRDDGTPRVRIARGETMNLAEEIMAATIEFTGRGGQKYDRDNVRDLLDALEYLVSINPVAKPKGRRETPTEAEMLYSMFLREQRESRGSRLVRLPGLEIGGIV